MTHLGQRLSALIDGELDGGERERVLAHVARCDACRDETAALRLLKRRMSALGDTAAGGAGLTGRLIGLSALASLHEQGGPPPAAGQLAPPAPGQRAGRYFLAGSIAVFLAGLGTAAVIAGGDSQPQAPTLPVRPSVDVLMLSGGHGTAGEARPARGPASFQPRHSLVSPHPGP